MPNTRMMARRHAIFNPFQYVGGDISLRRLKDFLAPNCFYIIDDEISIGFNDSEEKFNIFEGGWILKGLDGKILANCYTTEELNKLYVEVIY